MFITDLFEAEIKQVLVVYPGRFQPFHKGHFAVYNYLTQRWGRDNVYIATSNKTDSIKSPFNFSDKSRFMALTGVPLDRVVETANPYQAPELVERFPPDNTILIFAVSEKDMAEDPRFKSWTKKDGTPAYFQPMVKNIKEAAPLSQHGYIMTVPTFDFTVMGQPMRSATEIRRMYSQADDETRKKIVQDLFGRYSEDVKHILDNKLNAINESIYALVDAQDRLAEAIAANPERSTQLNEAYDRFMNRTLAEGRIRRNIAAALVAGIMATPSPAQTNNLVALALGVGVIGLRTANAIKEINDSSIRGEANQLLINIIKGDNNHNELNQLLDQNQDSQGPTVIPRVPDNKKVDEDAAGVGVVAKNRKMAKDPRYSMSMTVDVHPDTPYKNAKAMRLVDDQNSGAPSGRSRTN